MRLIAISVILACLLSCGALWIVLRVDRVTAGLSPGVALVLVIASAILAVPAMVVYERIPLVPAPRFIRLRRAARRLQKRAAAVGFHLPSGNGDVTDVALIVRRDSDAPALASRAPELLAIYLEELSNHSLATSPQRRAPQVHVVSREQIRRGGGAFHFWRDYGLF